MSLKGDARASLVYGSTVERCNGIEVRQYHRPNRFPIEGQASDNRKPVSGSGTSVVREHLERRVRRRSGPEGRCDTKRSVYALQQHNDIGGTGTLQTVLSKSPGEGSSPPR